MIRTNEYVIPHERQDERIEGPALRGDEHEEIPERRPSVAKLADAADAARHSRPFQRQLCAEARHEHFDAEKRLAETNSKMNESIHELSDRDASRRDARCAFTT